MFFTYVARMAATSAIVDRVIAGTGYDISATIGEKIVNVLATILQTPIVVVANTRGKRSK